MNTSVQVCAKDGTILYDVSNIRKLKKINEKNKHDAVVPDMISKIVDFVQNSDRDFELLDYETEIISGV